MRRTLFFSLLLTACPPSDDFPTDDGSSGTTHFTSGDSASVTSADPPTSGDSSSSDSESTGEYGSSSGDSSTGEYGSSSGDSSSGGTTSDSESSGGVDTGLECFPLEDILQDPEALEAKCELHPWKRADECNPNPPMPSCEEMIQILVEHEDCELTICDYEMCADAMATAECGVRPAVCDPLTACLNMPSPASELQKLYENFLRIFKAAATE